MLISKCLLKIPLTRTPLGDTIMTNAWSMLYDEILKMDEKTLNLGTPLTGAMGDDQITFHLDMNKDPNRYKYDEDTILKELQDYISGTYNAHYSAGDDKIQTLDLIEACGDGEAFCRSNILKYASRYDKKGTARRDIMKILHYAVLLMHFNDKNAKRETYPQ